jgi:hypothetical protein
MKNLSIFFLFVVQVFLTSCSKENQLSTEELSSKYFEESVVIISQPNIKSKSEENMVVRTFQLISFNSDYFLESRYCIDGVDYFDDGTYNDLIANDGIYSSAILLPIPSEKSNVNQYELAKSVKFKYNSELNNLLNIKTWWLECDMRVTHTGTSVLGFSCASGCIELYNCRFHIGND